MTQRQRVVLRPLTAAERAELERIVRARSERADRVARAQALLAGADGASFTEAAAAVGRKAGDGVSHLVARFNQEGALAVTPHWGGGAPTRYRTPEQERILREFHRPPDREADGTATWSLTTLQRALRQAPDGLPQVSTKTILHTLWDAGYTWQQNRTWCHTGTVVRKRKAGPVTVTDPDTTPKKP